MKTKKELLERRTRKEADEMAKKILSILNKEQSQMITIYGETLHKQIVHNTLFNVTVNLHQPLVKSLETDLEYLRHAGQIREDFDKVLQSLDEFELPELYR